MQIASDSSSETRQSVSVVMPVYNGAKYLARAIESILQQTFKKFEFVIVDDGSTDESLKILRHYEREDTRIVVVSRANTGIVGALNDGIAHSTGEFVVRMDADDISNAGRIEIQLSYLVANPRCVAVGAAVLFVDPEGRPLKIYHPCSSHEAIEAQLAEGNGGALVHPAVVFRRDALLQCGGYRKEYEFLEDLDLYARLLDVGQLHNVTDVLLQYRQHKRSINHVVGNRAEKAGKIVAALRYRKGLAPLMDPAMEGNSESIKERRSRRHWALEAVEGMNYNSAWANAVIAVCSRPWERSNWTCLRYVSRVRKEERSKKLNSGQTPRADKP